MKTHKLGILAALLLSAALFVGVPGCATSPLQTAAQVETVSASTVTGAVAVYRAAVRQGKLSAGQRKLAQDAFDRWKSAELLAIDVTIAAAQGGTNTTAITSAVNAATASLGDLEALLTSWGVTSATVTK